MLTLEGLRLEAQIAVVPKSTQYFGGEGMQRIVAGTGVECVRRGAGTTNELAMEAISQALRLSKYDAADISHLVYVTQTPDYHLPSNAALLAHELALVNAKPLHIVQSCSGYVHGLEILSQLLQDGQVGMLVCADSVHSVCKERDQSTAYLFSDAASCSVVSKNLSSLRSPPWEFVQKSVGKGFFSLCQPEGGKLSMNGLEIFGLAVENVPAVARKVIHPHTSAVYLHQANGNLLTMLQKMLPNGPRYPSIVKNYGNASMVSIPLCMCLIPPTGHTSVVGFGGGFHVAAADLGNLSSLLVKVIEL